MGLRSFRRLHIAPGIGVTLSRSSPLPSYGVARYSILALVLLVSAGCSTSVSADSVYGTYEADYPFGKSTLTLNHDGTFVQEVAIDGQQRLTAKGSWTFDAVRGEITLRGAMAAVDSFGRLADDWRTTQVLEGQPVERLWFRVAIETSTNYPYLKR